MNIAARIQGIAEAGEICLSEDVHADEEAAALLETTPVQSSRNSLEGPLADIQRIKEAAN